MDKFRVIDVIRTEKIIGIIRATDTRIALETARACITGGIRCLEVALTTPGGLDVISELSRDNDVIIGAGTVLDAPSARLAILAGAKFLLSPTIDRKVIEITNQYQVVSIPGAFSPTDVSNALRYGADIIKIFPAEMLGFGYIRSIAAPFPQALLMPSGGVDLDNIDSWLGSGIFALGIGGHLTAAGKVGDYDTVIANSRKFVQAVADWRNLSR